MKHYTSIEYLAIDISNQFGLDKLEFEDRIQWVKANQTNLEKYTEEAEEPHLYWKAVNAFRKALKGLPVGHTVALDSVCSGLQLMSVLTGCESGCYLTGLIDPDKRTDAYTLITQYMNEHLRTPVSIERKQSKEAIMTSLYGSEAKPREIFGDKTTAYYTFYQVLQEKATGAYWLLQELKRAWNPTTLAHSWTLPDGYKAYVPVMVVKEDRVSVSELNYTMSVQYYENEPEERGISLVANSIHSVDAYVLRSLVRRCNYNPKLVKSTLDLIEIELLERNLDCGREYYLDLELDRIISLYHKTNMVDVVVINYLTAENIYQVPTDYLKKLTRLLTQVLTHEPFEVITIHDSFGCHANHCNQLRYWYKEILAELVESTVLDSILSELLGEDTTIAKLSNSLGDKIRNSNYGIS